MMIKLCLTLTMSIFVIYTCSCQDINWKTAKNWKIYDIQSQTAIRYTFDTLKSFKSQALDHDSMLSFLRDVTVWPKEKYSLWMGSYLVTCELDDNKPRKMLVSTYAGFFYDQTTRRYYQVPAELVDEWLDFLNNTRKRMIVTE